MFQSPSSSSVDVAISYAPSWLRRRFAAQRRSSAQQVLQHARHAAASAGFVSAVD